MSLKKDMGVEPKIGVENPPKSSILIGFGTIINHPFWGTTIFGNTHIGGFRVVDLSVHQSQTLKKNNI